MSALGQSHPFARYLGYSIAVLAFVVSVVPPLIFRHTSSYSAPTAAYAVQIIRDGALTSPIPSTAYWPTTLRSEAEFSFPSLLLSSFLLVTNAPKEYAIFIPITGIASVVYFALARRIICSQGDANGYGVLFSALSYAYIASMRFTLSYVGRGTLGVILLSYFLLSYIIYLDAHVVGRQLRNSWLVMLVIFTLAMGYTYYFAALAAFLGTGLMIITLRILSPLVSSRMQTLSICLLSIALLVHGPFIYVAAGLGVEGTLSLGSFVEHVAIVLNAILRSDTTSTQYLLFVGVKNLDFFDQLTQKWISYALRLASAIAVVYASTIYRPRGKGAAPKLVWLFSLSIFFVSLSELAYLFVHPTALLRFLTIFGLPVMFFVCLGNLANRQNIFQSHLLGKKMFSQKTILSMFLLIIIMLGSLGSIRERWYQSVAKPFANQQVEPLSKFLLSHSSSEESIILTGDADYVANLFFIVFLDDSLSKVAAEPLRKDAFTLYESSLSGQRGPFIERMHARGIQFLLIVEDGRPIFGDESGYGYVIPSVSSLRLSLVYNDGRSSLYSLN